MMGSGRLAARIPRAVAATRAPADPGRAAAARTESRIAT